MPVYDIEVAIDWRLFTYRGKQRVTYRNRTGKALTELKLFTYPNIADLKRGGAPGLVVDAATVDGNPVRSEHSGPVLTVALSKPLLPNSTAKLAFDFQGVIYRMPDVNDDQATKMAIEQLMRAVIGDAAGSGGDGGYGVFSVANDIVSLGLWYPVMSAHDGKRWDLDRPVKAAADAQVGDVSHFDVGHYTVQLTVPRDVTVGATGLEVGRSIVGDKQVLKYEAAAVREFTIQASARYALATTTVDGVAVNSLYLTEHAGVGRKVLDHAAKALKFFNASFGAYPYAELDLAEAPLVGGAGGVEFPGIVTIAKMFYGPQGRVGSNQQLLGGVMTHEMMQETLEFVVAHEVAHEWWNAVVGSDSRRHPFVDEAMANHSALLYFEAVHGKEAAERQRTLQAKLGYQMARMMGGEDRPVDTPAEDFDNLFEYAGIVYGKGALFLDAMRQHARSDADHLKALATYYRKFAFAIATPKDLVDALVSASDDPLAARGTAKRWLKLRHGDADIGSFDVSSMIAMLGPLGTDPQIRGLLDSVGLGRIGDILKTLFDGDGKFKDGIDMATIVDLVGPIIADGDPTTEKLVGVVGALLADPDALTDPSKMTGIVTALAKDLIGDDPEMKALIDAAGGLLQRALVDDPGANRPKPGSRKPRAPAKRGP